MSMIQDVDAEQLARFFQHYQEALAQDCESKGDESNSSWERTPQGDRNRMITAARLTLLELSTTPSQPTRKYYAKYGEADWGC